MVCGSKEISLSSEPVIILQVKYEFIPKASNELKVLPNEYLKLVEKLGNGWLLVKHIDRIQDSTGLVPASYVTIVVNDSINPISNGLLYDSSDESYPVSAKINKFFQKADKRIWYRIVFSMLNGDEIKTDKHYQDFYNFHILLSSLNSSQLPKLPHPITSMNSDKLLNKRCSQLHTYFNKLISIESYQKSPQLKQFVQMDDQEKPSPTAQFSPTAPLPPVVSNYKLTRSNSDYNIELANSKYSTYINQVQSQDNLNQAQSSNTISSFSSLIDDYDDQDATLSNLKTCANDTENSLNDKSFTLEEQKHSFSSTSSDYNSLFSNRNNRTLTQPSTPVLSSHGFEGISSAKSSPRVSNSDRLGVESGNEFVKIKISINNDENDIILIKLKRSNIISIVYLKKLISFKIYKDCNLINHYKLQVDDDGLTEEPANDDELLTYIKSKSKICLKIVRRRESMT